VSILRPSLQAIACIALGVVLLLGFSAGPTLALWSASVSTEFSITSAEPPPASAPPVFRVGKSKATIVNGTGPFEPIAHIDGDRIWLDFGVLAEGNSNNSPEVLLIDNPGEVPYSLSAPLTTEIRGAFSAVWLEPATLSPGGTATLGMKLDTRGLAVGSYEGTLTVCDLSGAFSKDIPVRFEVVAPGGECGQAVSPRPALVAPPAAVGDVPGVEAIPPPHQQEETTATVVDPSPVPPEPPPADAPAEPIALLWLVAPERCACAPARRSLFLLATSV